MYYHIRKTALSALIGAILMTGMSAGARADNLYSGFDDDGDARSGVILDGRHDDRGPRRDDRWNRHNDDDDSWDGRDARRWDRHRRERGCSPDEALDKAERIGLRRARIVDVDRRTIEVGGRRFGQRVVVTFARAPRCPIIG